jgi:hypothetical protein
LLVGPAVRGVGLACSAGGVALETNWNGGCIYNRHQQLYLEHEERRKWATLELGGVDEVLDDTVNEPNGHVAVAGVAVTDSVTDSQYLLDPIEVVGGDDVDEVTGSNLNSVNALDQRVVLVIVERHEMIVYEGAYGAKRKEGKRDGLMELDG